MNDINWIPLGILAVMSLLSLGITMEQHGQKKKGNESIWMTLLGQLIAWGLIFWAIW